ncbi:inorganic diphosphatase [Cellvibrio japonicus]|uniref:Inorganic pyrophosphatase n=1 Tax=Cellvibrio japonicus (strain Ueda107) TaxID=498211 RepID=B3PIA3_CELJU|nr:inorganic diphosphatase [Cellvibrio japonicus]ACE86242.1 inorganic pyrophosphatase [Cellvibrio japonicus Ueda107]QEI11145.1 inorganic diphosphatase [Cellvibrio japonicus]QEI14719.1 inorganic diphosphatase [Cellvibrio japonicus]QEI18299.1 inorganic diphosphatase [Cellvibrio japonicus]
MSFEKIPAGKSLPDDFYVVIEIPANSSIKYEIDKDADALFVDRLISTPMYYPCNYGYIPQTLCGDGDAADVLVVFPQPVQAGSVIRCRPLGVLKMTDEAGEDAKIVAVPHDKLTTLYSKVQSLSDLPEVTVKQIEHFFEHYKDLEKGKWVKVAGWGDVEEARAEILKAVETYKASNK